MHDPNRQAAALQSRPPDPLLVSAPWVLASGNPGKLRELQAMLAVLGVRVQAQGELGIADAEEPHGTFLENALAKARHAAAASGQPALADDSGLCIPALGGAPGVHSARFAADRVAPGSPRPVLDAANNQLLLERCATLAEPVQACFVSVLVLVRSAADPCPIVADGVWWGTLARSLRGEGGFGYDPLFLPEGGQGSAAELESVAKNRVSHRARAMQALLERVRPLLTGTAPPAAP